MPPPGNTRKNKHGRPPLHPGPTELERKRQEAEYKRIGELRIRIPKNTNRYSTTPTPHLKKASAEKTPKGPSPTPSPVYRSSGYFTSGALTGGSKAGTDLLAIQQNGTRTAITRIKEPFLPLKRWA